MKLITLWLYCYFASLNKSIYPQFIFDWLPYGRLSGFFCDVFHWNTSEDKMHFLLSEREELYEKWDFSKFLVSSIFENLSSYISCKTKYSFVHIVSSKNIYLKHFASISYTFYKVVFSNGFLCITSNFSCFNIFNQNENWFYFYGGWVTFLLFFYLLRGFLKPVYSQNNTNINLFSSKTISKVSKIFLSLLDFLLFKTEKNTK